MSNNYNDAVANLLQENKSLRARLAACERVVAVSDRMYPALPITSRAEQSEHERAVRAYRATLTTPLDDDDGPNDGHARTVNRTPPGATKVAGVPVQLDPTLPPNVMELRSGSSSAYALFPTPPQDAATTRGEG